jgi:DNA-binding LytR/AlgR family response regulator
MITCAIVEDNEKDIKQLKQFLLTDKRFQLYPTIINATNWSDIMLCNKFDVLFLDIELNGYNAFDLLKGLSFKPEVVVVSSYPKYAMQAFEFDVAHFIQKPLRGEHILAAMERVYKRVVLKEHKPIPDSFFLQTGRNKYMQLFFNEITHITSESEYIKFNLLNDKPVMVYQRLKNIIPELPNAIFMQVHRSAVVNTRFIKSIDGNTLQLMNKDEVLIGASFKKQLIALINR